MTHKENKRRYGLSLRAVVIIMFLIDIAITGMLIVTMHKAIDQYDDVEQATSDFLTCQNDVYKVRDAILLLHNRTENFVYSGNTQEIILYFNEIQVQRNRDLGLENVKRYLGDDQTLKHLNAAIELSERMMDTQLHAMRLAVEAYALDISKLPPALRTVELTPEELALTKDDQLDIARSLLFSKNYLVMKEQVDVRIDLCKNQLVAAMNAQHSVSSSRLKELLSNQRYFLVILTVALFLVMIFVLALVVNPLYRLISDIRNNSLIKTRGSSEIRFLTETYNHMMDNMERTNSRLSYEAAHDSLTGLYNRSSYEELREQSKDRNIALLVVDIDFFKDVNDTYGHTIGDEVLIRVARVLSDSFRDADKVCRIGGDEFCIIMMDVTSEITEVIRRKIASAAEILKTPKNEIPPVTLSVGVAFSDQLKEGENLFKNADKALYSVKENGRNGCGFYPSSGGAIQESV